MGKPIQLMCPACGNPLPPDMNCPICEQGTKDDSTFEFRPDVAPIDKDGEDE